MRIVAVAILMCAVMVLVAGAPLVTADTHHVVKGAQGPRASTVSWDYAPTVTGVWNGHVVNSGLRSLVVDVNDVTTGAASSILHQRIRFATTGDDMTTSGANMAKNHKYNISVTPTGPRGTSCIVDDVFTSIPQPVALFNYSVYGATVIVDGSASYDPNPGGSIMGWGWDWGDGTVMNGMVAVHQYSAAKTYTITLTVISSSNMTGSTSQDVTLVDNPPVASFTITTVGLTVSVDASSSHDDYGIVSYAWNWGDTTTGTGITASHTYAAQGLYAISLTVTDTIGQTSMITRPPPPPGPPVAAFTCTVSGWTVSVDASASTANWGIVSYAWNWGDTSSGVGVIATHNYLASGTYTITLTVTDSLGQTNSVSKSVTFGGDMPPVASFTVTVNGNTVSVDASSSVDDRGIVDYAWSWGDSTSGSGVTAAHTYAQSGVYSITLTVTDTNGHTGSMSNAVPIGVDIPVTSFTATVSGTSVSVDGSASYSGVGIVSYEWNFDGVVIAYGVTHTHIYVSHGVYKVTLTVTDTLGNTNSCSQAVTVSSSLPPDTYWYTVYGTTHASDGVTPLGDCALTMTNIRTGETMIGIQSDDTGFYACDISPLTVISGDNLIVYATGPAGQMGSVARVIDFSSPYMMIDVTLSSTPASSLTKSAITSGVKFTFAPMSEDTTWSDVSILLTDGTNNVLWKPATVDMVGAGTITHAYSSQMLGTLRVYCNVTDLAGNGYVNQGDYFTLTVGGGVFSVASTYTAVILHNPTGSEICHSDFQG